MTSLNNIDANELLDFANIWADLSLDVRMQISDLFDDDHEEVNAEDIRDAVEKLRDYPTFVEPLVEWLKVASEPDEDAETVLLSEIAAGLAPMLDTADTALRAILISKGHASICSANGATEITPLGRLALEEELDADV